MRHHLREPILFLVGLLSLATAAQPLYTKDAVLVGDRKDFIRSCRESAGEELLRFDGVDINTRHFCACMCDVIIPELTSKELIDLGNDQKAMEAMLLSDRFIYKLMGCVPDDVQIDDDTEMAILADNDVGRRAFMVKCQESAMAELDDEPWAERFAEEYCACALERMIEAKLDYGELLRADNTDERAFNEVIMPCVNAFARDLQAMKQPTRATGVVHGCTRSVVPLVDLLGQGYNVRLSMGGVVRYFLLDTGASDLMIGNDLAEELRRKGLLTVSSELGGTSTYTLANGERVRGRMVLISEVVIGDCRVEDVVAAVVDGGSLLCGRSFLDHFSHWEISGSAGELLLVR
jgi:clan AA aspartic protease (TIGR02281 family)